MRRIFSLALVVAAVALAMGMGLAPVAAQDQNASNETAPVEPTGTPIDERLTLTDWSYSDGAFELTFYLSGDRPKMATISEATQGDEGAGRFSIKQQRILPGNTTIAMPARSFGGHAGVTITTAASLRRGNGVKISTGSAGQNPFAPFGGSSGLISGVGLSILMSGGAAAWVLRSEESGVIQA